MPRPVCTHPTIHVPWGPGCGDRQAAHGPAATCGGTGPDLPAAEQTPHIHTHDHTAPCHTMPSACAPDPGLSSIRPSAGCASHNKLSSIVQVCTAPLTSHTREEVYSNKSQHTLIPNTLTHQCTTCLAGSRHALGKASPDHGGLSLGRSVCSHCLCALRHNMRRGGCFRTRRGPCVRAPNTGKLTRGLHSERPGARGRDATSRDTDRQ